MKVSKKSWHYRLMDKVGLTNSDGRKDLCSYMRGIIITIFLPILLVISPYILFYIAFFSNINEQPPIVQIVIVCVTIGTFVATAFDVIVIIAIISEFYTKRIKPYLPEKKHVKKQHKEPKPDKPNIFIEYLKAKKKKICPLIEFVDE